MPGIFGYINWKKRGTRIDKDLPSRMGGILTLFNEQRYIAHKIAPGFVGYFGFPDALNRFTYSDEDLIVLLDGEIFGKYQEGKLRGIDESTWDADLIAGLYKQEGVKVFESIMGGFTCLVYDVRKRTIYIFNDRFGLRPLYYWFKDDTLVFASQIKAILQCEQVENRIDYTILESLITIGFQLGDGTLINDVKAFPQASILSSSPKGLEIRQYYDMCSGERQKLSKSETLDILKEGLSSAVERYLKKGEGRLGSFLSGGYDSRLIAGLSSKIAPSIPVFTHPTGSYGDVELAMEVGRALGLKHYFIPLGDDYILRHSARHTWVVEGEADATCSHFYDTMPPIGNYIDTILDGTAGGLIMGSHTNPKVLPLKDRVRIFNFIFERKLNRYFQQNRHKEILTPQFQKQTQGFSYERARSLFMEMADLSSNLLLDFFHLKTYIPRYLFSGLKNIREFVEVRSPFFDYYLFEFAQSMAPEYRLHRRLYRRALAELVPESADIKSTNLYMPPSAGEIGLFFARVRDKLTSYYDRFFPDRGKQFSRFTYDYNYALREPCRDFVKELLLCDRTLDRGIFKRDFIYELVGDHLSGKRNLMRQVGYMISIELFFRLFIDHRPQAREFDIYGNYL